MMEDFTWDGIVRAIREDEHARIVCRLTDKLNRADEVLDWDRARRLRDAIKMVEEEDR